MMVKNKKEEKILLESLYNEFISLYDENLIEIGKVFLFRLKTKHYKKDVYKTINTMIRWFYASYGEGYKARISCSGRRCFIVLYDNNKNIFAIYYHHKGIIINSEHDTNPCQQMLIKEGILTDVHYIV